MDAHTSTRIIATTDPSARTEAADALRRGELVAFPTDTVYGVGCDLWQPEAIERLYRAKRRPRDLAIPILVASPEGVERVAADLPQAFRALAARYWPGGLTLIVRKGPAVPDVLSGGRDTVGLRMPDYPLVQQLAAELGGALAATSANLSGKPSPVSAEQVLDDLGGRIALLLDGGRCSGGVASSVVDVVSDPPVLLRAGAIALEELREVVPSLRAG
jgi:L-threonylcarbamoyladenylate synthase